MSQITHNISFPNDGNGDELRTAFANQNLNNTELYNTKVDKVIGKELSSNDYTNAEKLKLASLNVNAEQNVQVDFLQNDPLADDYIKNKPVGMLASVGYFDYNDTLTTITPLVLVSNVEKKLTNNTLGAFTITSAAPYGVTSIWNTLTNQFDFTQLSIDDTLDFRVDCELETQYANQTYTLYLRIGVGTVAPVDIVLYRDSIKTATSLPNGTSVIGQAGIYIGSDLYRNAPAELYIKTDGGGKLQVNGWYVRIVRKGLNVATILGDNLKVDKVTTLGTERVYTINPDGTQGTKPLPAGGGKQIRCFYGSWNFTTINTWRSWDRNTSIMNVLDANRSLGTGATPSSFVDCNFLTITNVTKLSKVSFSLRDPANIGGQTIEFYIKSFTLANNVVRGSETNNQVLVQETYVLPASGNNGFKDNFTIATHTLDNVTGIQIAFRQTTGTVSGIQGVQLILDFE